MTGPIHGAVLHDGFGCGLWRLERGADGATATLVVNHAGRLTKRATAALAAEGRRLLALVAAEAETREVRFVAVD